MLLGNVSVDINAMTRVSSCGATACKLAPLYPIPRPRSQEGWTPLHVAAYHNNADVVCLLLSDTRLDVRKSTGVSRLEGSASTFRTRLC